jgi:hypothetical protein
MTEIPIPENYEGTEYLYGWLLDNFPLDDNGHVRWRIIGANDHCIRFFDDNDATLFALKWE